jgi:hypothetical protein
MAWHPLVPAVHAEIDPLAAGTAHPPGEIRREWSRLAVGVPAKPVAKTTADDPFADFEGVAFRAAEDPVPAQDEVRQLLPSLPFPLPVRNPRHGEFAGGEERFGHVFQDVARPAIPLETTVM